MNPAEIMQLLRNGQIDEGRAIKALTEFYQSRGTALGLADEMARTEVREVASSEPGRLPQWPQAVPVPPDMGKTQVTAPVRPPPGDFLDWAGTDPLPPIPPTYRGTAEDRAQADVLAADMAAPAPAAAGGYVDPRSADQIAREEASLTYGGRQNIFGGFMGAQPGFGQLNPLVQRGLNRAFGPLSAQFALQAALDPYWTGTQGTAVDPGVGLEGLEGVPRGAPAPLDFRAFLKETPQRWGQQEWINQLAPLGAAFSAASPSLPQQALREQYGDEAMQNRLMSAVLGQGVSPFLRRFVPGAIGRRRQQMFETDPSVMPFQQFLPDPLAWGRA